MRIDADGSELAIREEGNVKIARLIRQAAKLFVLPEMGVHCPAALSFSSFNGLSQ
jgi:hypothetical protein